jgi:hypothetical protein
MATSPEISVGVCHELAITACKVGWEPEDFAALAHSEENVKLVLAFLRGQAKITEVKHVVDCSAALPSIQGLTPLPESEQVASRFRGEFTLTPEALALHLDPGQTDGKVMTGNALRTALEGTPVYTAHVLDAYLAHPEFIPESLKKDVDGNTVYIYFWGTVYRGGDGNLCVRCLCWRGGAWGWFCCWLEFGWRSRSPVAVPASI